MHVKHPTRALYAYDLTPAERLVLATLADVAHDERRLAYPSRATLCARSGLSHKTVQRCLARLIALDYISQAAPARPGQNRTFRLYPERWPEPPSVRRDRAPTESDRIHDAGPAQDEHTPLWAEHPPEMVDGMAPPF